MDFKEEVMPGIFAAVILLAAFAGLVMGIGFLLGLGWHLAVAL